MQHSIKIVIALFIATIFFSCKENGKFIKLSSGLEYKIVKDEKGDKKVKEGDIITMHIKTMLGDSIVFNSREQNNNQPVPAQISKPNYNGDLMEGLTFLTVGDSAVFRVAADSIFRTGLPPFAKSGDTVQFFVKLVSVQTMEEYKKQEDAAMQNAINEEEGTITKWLQEKGIQNAQKASSGLYYIITKAGSGENAKRGQEVSMKYTGKLLDGTTFDSNVDPKFNHTDPFNFTLGSGQVIRGWEEGITLLNKGAKATLIIPSPMGYGERGMPGNQINPGGIPPNSVLTFDVEVLNIKEMDVK